jgi:hypothetical protein
MKVVAKLAAVAFAVFILLQLVRPSIPTRPVTAEVQASPEVKRILAKDCYACHSDERKLSWFDQIVPAYWLVRYDILIARRHLNFSTLGSKPAAAQRATLFEAANMIQLGAMPLPQFVQLHPEAKANSEELAVLKNYLAPWGTLPRTFPSTQAPIPGRLNLASVQPEWNGLSFDPSYENWSLLSVTDRGDNDTFRFILGNDVALKALQSHNISPWPDGTKFAKIAWQQALGNDDLVHTGNFIQIELMVKDAARYKTTDGWGWGRWRGLDLEHYGNDADFVNECTGCHQPMRGNDYVYTMPMASNFAPDSETVNVRAASFGGKPISSNYKPVSLFVDRKARTISVLFANESASSAIAARSGELDTKPQYPDGAKLELMTWNERDDPHWFGARIPDQPISLETLEFSSQVHGSVYRRLNGAAQPEQLSDASIAQRTALLLSLRSAPLP